MSAWETRRLADVVELRRGFDLPHRDRRPGPFPVLSAGLTAGWHDEGPVKGPGFVIGRATNLGKPTWSDVDFWPLNTTLYAADFKGNHPRWLALWFETLDLSGFDSGSVQPMLNRNNVAEVPVLVPPLAEQRAIVEVLGALDDKIAANHRLCTVGMERLRTTFAASTAPGTRSVAVADMAEFLNSRRVPLSARERDERVGDVPYYGATGVFGYVDEPLFDEPLVLVGEDGSVITEAGHPVLQYVWGPAWVNNHAHVLRGRGISTELLYLALGASDVAPVVTGAVQPKLSMRSLKSVVLRLPGAPQLAEVEADAEAWFSVHRAKSIETSRLAATRDALLPALMSGRLHVRDAEKVVSDAL